jgi:hypothetical protein
MLTPPQVATLLKKFSLASVCKCPPCMPALCLRPYRMRVWFKRKFRRWFDNFVTGQVKITYETSQTFTRNFPALGMHASSTCLLVHLILILLQLISVIFFPFKFWTKKFQMLVERSGQLQEFMHDYVS